MKHWILWSIISGIGIGLVAGATTYKRELDQSYGKPNILILSLCSLRKDDLGYFAQDKESITPNIDRAFRSGLNLEQVFSSYGWTNLALYFYKAFDEKFLGDNGYDVIDDESMPMRVDVRGPQDKGRPEQIVNHVHPKLHFLKSRISLYRRRPFFAYVHIKYMHFPYIDSVNPEARWDHYLTANEKLHFEKVLADPKLLRDRLPFALTLTGDLRLINQTPEYHPLESDPLKIFFGLYNLMVDRSSLAKWKVQADYELELGILRKVYRAKLNQLDSVLADILNLYGRRDLLENTILVLMGDHGEAFMEHDQLGHAMHVYDEILSPPVMVRFPRTWRPHAESIDNQIYMGSLVDWLMTAIRGGSKEQDFRSSVVNNSKNEYIVSRNCSNNIHSVRFNNQWKLIVDRAGREKFLFDLRRDPNEKVNVWEQNQEIAAKLEYHLASHLQDLDTIHDPTPCQF